MLRVVVGLSVLLLGTTQCGETVTTETPDGVVAAEDAPDTHLGPDTGCSKGCNDSNPCTSDQCEGSTCTHSPILDKGCDDGNPCTTQDLCGKDGCVGSKQVDCDDKNTCTIDSCNPASGCVYSNNDGGPCDDGDGCTLNDACKNGKCGTGGALTCDDGNACTTDICDIKTGCQFANNTAPCTDGNTCTLGDVCAGGKCTAGALKLCADGNGCTEDKCDAKTGDCVFQPNAVTCDDGNALTQGDTCFAGQCVGTPGCGCTADAQCDDKNPCTKDVCAAGCCVAAALPGNVTCSDGNTCTVNDACDGGSCIPGAKQSCDDGNLCTDDICLSDVGCTHTPNTVKCDDGISCSTDHVCKAGVCTGNISTCSCGSNADCYDFNTCTEEACVNGKCSVKAAGAGKACQDGNACTVGDTCLGGICLPGALTTCDDDNVCTNDACNPGDGGCVHVANYSPCADGNACTTGDVCAGGVCKAGAPVNCDDANTCTDDACDPTATTGANGCAHTANAATCDDGSACTQNDVCGGGVCTGVTVNACDDANPCTLDGCDAGAGGGKVCAHGLITGPCDDGNPCTTDDVCSGVTCVGAAMACDDQNACTDDSCDATGTCQHNANVAPCSDGNACTTGDHCGDGSCVPGAVNACDDQDGCTWDACDAFSGCTHSPKADGDVCADASCSGLVHNAANTCLSGVCVPGGQLSCADNTLCTDDACDPSVGCTHTANTAACSDGNLCTVGDVCGGGVCLPGAASNCDDGNLCSVDACDPSGGCQHAATTDGALCASAGCVGLVLGKGGTCAAGSCQLLAAPVDCDDKNACTDDFCSPLSGCSHQTNAVACSDGNPCTADDTCALGVCVGGPAPSCSDQNVCTDDACSAADGCTHTPVLGGKACDDGSVCTVGDACAGGTCQAGSALVCDDKNACTTDACNAKSGCAFSNNTAPCDDGSQCTTGDVCADGKCGAAVNPCDDANPCTTDGCDGLGGCKHTLLADGASCSSQGCTGLTFQGAATCSAGVCGSAPPPELCDDANACTDDLCNGLSGCLHPFNTAQCDDGNVCSTGDACISGACVGTVATCADGGACTLSLGCDPVVGCQYQPASGTGCSDGNACTIDDVCTAGVCAGATPMGCDDNNSCTVDSCDPAKGCIWAPMTSGACSDGNVCTGSTGSPDACVKGVCVGGATKNCTDQNGCTNDSCDPTSGCKYTNNTASCKDGNRCTTGDVCSGGTCKAGTTVVCDDGNPCTVDSCDPGDGCQTKKVTNGTACGGNTCSGLKYTAVGACTSGQCILPGAKNCDDGISCTLDACVGATGCSNTTKAWGATCTPGNASLLSPFCAEQTCTGFEVKVGDPSPATQGALTSIDANAVGLFASGWDNSFTGAATQGDIRGIDGTTLTISNAGYFGVAKSKMNDLRDVIAVGGVGDNVPAMMIPGLTSYVPFTPVTVPTLTRALNAVDAFPIAGGATFVFGGGGNSSAEFQSNAGWMQLVGGNLSTISRLMITTSPTQCDKQVPMTVSDVYAASDAAIYFAGYIGDNGQSPTKSAVAVWDGSVGVPCDGVDFTYSGEAYVNTPVSTVDRVVSIGTGLGQGSYRTIHGTGPGHLLVGGTQGTLWSFDNGVWTQQTPVVPGANAWSTQYDVKSVYLSNNDGWATGEFYGPSGGSSNCRQVFVLHGIFDAASGLWTWNQLVLPGLVDCGANIANTQANKIWRDAATKSIYVVGSFGGKELVARIQLP